MASSYQYLLNIFSRGLPSNRMPQWSFLSNHGAVLALIAQNKAIKATDIAAQLELTERSVRRIIADMYNEGYIKKKYEGGVNHYEIIGEMPLRRKAQQNVNIRELLKALGLKFEAEDT